MILLGLAACTSADPELVARGRAVREWRAGVQELEQSPDEAVQRFQAALKAHDDPLLEAWVAEGLAREGRLEQAVEGLQRVVERAPALGEARYNLAAYLARQGRLEEAGQQLALALRTSVRRPRQAMVDPDFAPHLQHPAFAFLPQNLLMVTVDVPPATLFWGNEAHVRVRVLGSEAAPLQIGGAITGPLTLLRAEEGVVDTTEGPAREVVWVFRVDGQGTSSVGPFTVRAAGHEEPLRARTFQTTAPPGREGEVVTIEPLVMHDGLPQEVGAQRVDGMLWVRTEPGDGVVIRPPPTEPPVQLKLLDRGRVTALLDRYRADGPRQVTIRRAGTTVFEGER